MRFVLATHNPGKLREMGEILKDFGIEVVSPRDLGITVDVEETGTTFAENALLKAKAICKEANLPAIADDSGLCVDALGGAPGVYSARYGGEGLDDKGRYMLLLQLPAGRAHPGGALRLRGGLRLPQRGHPDSGGPLRRLHRLRPPGGGRLRLRPRFSAAGHRQDLWPADPGGEVRRVPPRTGAEGLRREAGSLSEEVRHEITRI